MNIKKTVARFTIGFMSVIAIGGAVVGAVAQYNTPDTNQAVHQTASTVTAFVADSIAPEANALLVQSGSVSIESTDLTNVSDSVTALLKSCFEVLKLLPYMALIIGGFYLLDAVIGILPHPTPKRGA